jgi:hypothetical protein
MPCLRGCGGGKEIIRQEPDTMRSGSVCVPDRPCASQIRKGMKKESYNFIDIPVLALIRSRAA